MKKIPNKNVSAEQNFKKWIENKIVSAQTFRSNPFKRFRRSSQGPKDFGSFLADQVASRNKINFHWEKMYCVKKGKELIER